MLQLQLDQIFESYKFQQNNKILKFQINLEQNFHKLVTNITDIIIQNSNTSPTLQQELI